MRIKIATKTLDQDSHRYRVSGHQQRTKKKLLIFSKMFTTSATKIVDRSWWRALVPIDCLLFRFTDNLIVSIGSFIFHRFYLVLFGFYWVFHSFGKSMLCGSRVGLFLLILLEH